MKKIFKKWYTWVGLFFLLIIILGSSGRSTQDEVASESEIQQQLNSQNNNSHTEAALSPAESAPAVSVSNTSPIQQTSPTSPIQFVQKPQSSGYKVVEVVDGDTIKVNINGVTETLRIIGLNTPETVDPRKPVECFGKEASNKGKELLSGKTVTLEADASQGERDKYSRLLRYVFVDSMDYGKYMIQSGYAYEYTYNTPYKYQAAYKSAQANAEASRLGLWNSNTCNGTSTSSPSVQTSPTNNSQSTYICSSNTYNCTDFSTHAEAQHAYEYCGGINNDIHKLDQDNNGQACEDLP